MATIELSAMGPSIAEQLDKLGLEQVGLKVDILDRLHHAITLAHIHGCLTEAECNRARKRLIKKLKLRDVK